MAKCLACLKQVGTESQYHADCLVAIFGSPLRPEISLDRSGCAKTALEMVGKMSISGMQEKVSLALSPDKKRLIVAPTGGRYILKPQSSHFRAIAENEHLTMRLASLVKIETPACALIPLRDGSLAYIVSRFDRLDGGGKLQVEDFCQLALVPPKDKYDGSAELCVRILRQYASEPQVEVLKLFRLLVFGWCVGNGDMHLKNFSLLTGPDGVRRLSPAYDLMNTRLVIPEDPLALPVGGKKANLKRADWLRLAAYAGLPERIACRVLDSHIAAESRFAGLVRGSFLSEDLKTDYLSVLRERLATISPA